MENYKIHLIRHAITDGNVESRYIGLTDIPVNQKGIDAVKKIMEEHSYPYIEKLYSSPLLRCKQTANMIYPDINPVLLDEFVEYNFGDFEGKTFEELKKDPVFAGWIKGQNSPPNGETIEQLTQRCQIGFAKILDDMMKNKIMNAAVVTHGGIIGHILSQYGIPKKSLNEWICENAKGYTIHIDISLWMRSRSFEIANTVPKTLSMGKVEGGFDRDYAEITEADFFE